MVVTFQPYTPATSLGDELAIIFAFSVSMAGTMIIYVFFWRSMLHDVSSISELQLRHLISASPFTPIILPLNYIFQ